MVRREPLSLEMFRGVANMLRAFADTLDPTGTPSAVTQ